MTQYPQAPYPQYPAQYPNQYGAPQGAPGAPGMPPAGALDSVLDGVDQGEKAGGNRLPRLGKGNHVLLVDSYYAFDTRSDGKAISAEFVVESSDTLTPGTRASVAWFPNAGNVDRQKFERGRISEYCAALDACIGKSPRSTKEVGRDLVNGPSGEMPKLRGLKLRCSAWEKIDRKTGAPVVGKKGPVYEYSWQAIGGQSYESAAASCATMPPQMPNPQTRGAAPHAALQPQYAPPQYQPQYAPPPAAAPAAPSPQGYAPAAPAGLPPGYPVPPPAGMPNPYAAQPAPQGQPNFVTGLRG